MKPTETRIPSRSEGFRTPAARMRRLRLLPALLLAFGTCLALGAETATPRPAQEDSRPHGLPQRTPWTT
ncbi:MAG: hypothetical protein ACKPAH_14750, partial [Verrucomicrobiota bacterium]